MPKDIVVFDRNSEAITEIIGATPSWILRRGILIISIVIILIFAMSALIQYPDIVKTTLKINSLNAPKNVLSKQTGKLVRIIVRDKQHVKEGDILAFLESTAKHEDVLFLKKGLVDLRKNILNGKVPEKPVTDAYGLQIGELQSSYQVFYQAWLQFKNTQAGGNGVLQKAYMRKDLLAINELRNQLLEQRKWQLKENVNIEKEYEAYTKLADKGVISKSEYNQQQNKYYSSKIPLQQLDASILNNQTENQAKRKEISDHDNNILLQQQQFMQVMNSMISETEIWIQKFILSAPVNGIVSYSGTIQVNQNIAINQEIFIVNPGNSEFFGEIQIPQYNMGKIKQGQRTLVKLRSYPFEEYGLIEGKVGLLSDVAFRDSVFVTRINFNNNISKNGVGNIVLKNGMLADAEIITEDATLLQRFLRNIKKMINTNSR